MPSFEGIVSDFPVVEILKDQLYFTCFTKPPPPSPNVEYFCTDKSLVYWNFFLDFGPMNLGQTFRFCELVKSKLHPNKRVVYYCAGNHGQRRSNSVMLICAYQVLILHRTALDAFRPFSQFVLPPFHDATPCHCSYDLTVLDCLQGLERAKRLNFVNFDTFDINEYEHFEKVESGDLSWIFPGKFVAFAGPHEVKSFDECYPKCVPEDYVEHFLHKRVGLVVRLNKKYYDENRFIKHGIAHCDLYFPDGSNPSLEVVSKFLTLCENFPGSVAVHCKAGLGRTGTLIGAYAMKHFGFSAKEVVGWMRLVRPGSVIGPQQQYMDVLHEFVTKGTGKKPKHHLTTVVTPFCQEEEEKEEDLTQGDLLLNAKQIHSPHMSSSSKKTLEQSPSSSSSLYSLRMTVTRRLYGK